MLLQVITYHVETLIMECAVEGHELQVLEINPLERTHRNDSERIFFSTTMRFNRGVVIAS